METTEASLFLTELKIYTILKKKKKKKKKKKV